MRPNKYKGKFIVVDSLDGYGQSTQINFIEKYLKSRNIAYWRTKEPTKSNKFGIYINDILDKKIKVPDPKTLQELFSKDRELHQEEIIKHLKMGEVVLCDRYFPSTFAYGGAFGVDLIFLEQINWDFVEPDITIILKVSPKVAAQRIVKRGEMHKLFEKEEMLARVWPFYELYAQSHKNVFVVNGELDSREVFEKIKAVLNKLL